MPDWFVPRSFCKQLLELRSLLITLYGKKTLTTPVALRHLPEYRMTGKSIVLVLQPCNIVFSTPESRALTQIYGSVRRILRVLFYFSYIDLIHSL